MHRRSSKQRRTSTKTKYVLYPII